MAVNDVWRISVVANQFGNEVRNLLHFRDRSGTGSINALLAALRDDVIDGPWSSAVADTMSFRRLEARSLIPYGQGVDLNINIAGQRAGGANANQVAAVITLKTISTSRRKRGRLYVGGTVQTDIDILTGLFEAPYLTALGALVTALSGYTAAADPDWDLGVWSRLNGQEVAPFPPTPVIAGFENVTQFVVRDNPGTFRTRRLGHGS